MAASSPPGAGIAIFCSHVDGSIVRGQDAAMSHPELRARPIDWVMLLTLVVLWGSAFAFTDHAVQTMPPAAVAFIRLLLGAIMLTVYAFARGRRFPKLTDRRWLWFAGLGFTGNALPFVLIASAQQHIDSAVAGILVATMPIFTLCLAHVFVPNEKMTRIGLIGFLLGFGGVGILMGPEALTGLGGSHLLAQLAVIGGAICYAVNSILARLMPDTPPSVSGAGMLIGGALFTAPIGVWTMMQSGGVAPLAWASAVWLAAGPTAFASVLLMRIARRPGPTFLAVVNYLTPIAAVATGVIIGEAIGVRAIAALGVILGGVLLARRGAKKLSQAD